jgi:hypothetical protein
MDGMLLDDGVFLRRQGVGRHHHRPTGLRSRAGASCRCS